MWLCGYVVMWLCGYVVNITISRYNLHNYIYFFLQVVFESINKI